MCCGQVGGVARSSDHDHLLRCGQTVAPRLRILKAFQCIMFDNHFLLSHGRNLGSLGCGDLTPPPPCICLEMRLGERTCLTTFGN